MSHPARRDGLLFAVAALTAFGPLAFYYVGEEGILTITSMEMWQRGDWLKLWMYGLDAMHGVFANWLIIPVAAVLGWEYVLPVARGVMVLSTIATGFVLYALLRRLGRDTAWAWLAAVVYITFADILIYRGWLAYRDPLFGFLVFAAIAALWIGARESRWLWFVWAAVLAFAAFLTKGLTAYVFLGSAALVLLVNGDTRRNLLRPGALFSGAITLALPLLWLYSVQSGDAQAVRFADEIGRKLVPPDMGAWALKLLSYPVETLLRLLPGSGIALYVWLQYRAARSVLRRDPVSWTAAVMLLLGFLPYWLAPHSHFRYLLPIVPLAAIVFAGLIMQGGDRVQAIARRLLWGMIALKVLFVALAFPVYQTQYRGANYAIAAQKIVEQARGRALYTVNVSASGLSVVSNIDVMRMPLPALTWPPEGWRDGFVIAYDPDPQLGAVAAQYRLGGDVLYLLCRGSACADQPGEGLRR